MDRTILAALLLAGFSTDAALPSGAAARRAEAPQAGQPAPRGTPEADLAAVAARLGVAEAALRDAPPPSPQRP